MENVIVMFAELHKFSSDVVTLNGPANAALIAAFEETNSLRLPEDYKSALQQSNGFSVMGDQVYGVLGTATPESLENVYHFEHFDVAYPQPSYLVPFSPDGGGNFYCFDTRHQTSGGQSCPVVFWVSNYQYTDEDAPEVVNASFVDFVNDVLIGWTLADYDYKGNERQE